MNPHAADDGFKEVAVGPVDAQAQEVRSVREAGGVPTAEASFTIWEANGSPRENHVSVGLGS